MIKELKDYLKNIKGVSHITLDPNGPGVVRIHLIPPKKVKMGITWVVIINGYAILPLTSGWAILLREFINHAIKYDGKSISEDEIKTIINETVNFVSKLFHKTKKSTLRNDLKDIIQILVDIAHGKEPKAEIGYLPIYKYAKYMSAPHRMDLMISSMHKDKKWHCNQKCLHCYAGEQKLAIKDELSTNDWFEIIDKCRDACISQLTFTGGEPTLRTDLVELVEHAAWFVTRLNTNGILLTKELCKKLYDASLDSVQVTLYSYDEKIHNFLTGSNSFNKTIEGIKNAIEAGLNVSINTPLVKLNSDYLNTVKFAQSLGITYFTCSGMIMTGSSLSEMDMYLTKEELLSKLSESILYANENDLEINFTSPGILDVVDLNKLKLVVPSCGACLSNMAIAPDGEVIPCQSWLSDDGLGNMLNDKWKNIWNNKKTIAIRKKTCRLNNICQLSPLEVEKK